MGNNPQNNPEQQGGAPVQGNAEAQGNAEHANTGVAEVIFTIDSFFHTICECNLI